MGKIIEQDGRLIIQTLKSIKAMKPRLAKVKNITLRTEKNGTVFVLHMRKLIGKVIEVIPVKRYPDTFRQIGGDRWYFAAEWLTFIGPR